MGLFEKLESKLDELDKKFDKLGEDEELDDEELDDEEKQTSDDTKQKKSKSSKSQAKSSGNTYDSELEKLIDVALTDGELTDKEKQILIKKAQSKGIDPDEFEMVLDARIYKMKQQQNPQKTAPKSNKHGEIKKCPACGAMIQSFQGVCPTCGYAFENVEVNSSVRKLAEKLEKYGKNEEFDSDDYEKMASIMSRFTIPTTKADIVELIMLIQTQLSSLEGKDNFDGEIDVYRSACKAKLQECSFKARLMFPNDPMLQSIINETGKINTEAEISRKRHNTVRTIVVIISFVIGISVGLYLGFKMWDWCSEWKTIWRVIVTIYVGAIPISLAVIPLMAIKRR